MIIMNISNALRENIQLYRNQLIQKKIQLFRQFDSNITVYSDERHLRLITRDLTTNAVSFTHEEGTVTLEINEIDCIHFSYSDEDFTVPDQFVSKDAHLSDFKVDGDQVFETGLGLSLSIELLKENNCKVEIENIPALGTSIHVFIPKKKYVSAKTVLKSREVQITVADSSREAHA